MNPKLRQAAILIASLDSTTADALLDQLPAEQAATVRRMIVALDEVDDAEQKSVISQFLGIDAEEVKSSSPNTLMPLRPAGPPFQFLHEAPCEKLLVLLAGEHPQTIAVVVSHLPPQQAAQLLFILPPTLQADVMRRLVDLEETDPAILYEVERGLEQRIARHVQTERRRTVGAAALVSILESADSRLQGQLQANLRRHAPQLARLLPAEPASPCFDDLCLLDDGALVELLDAAEPQTVTLALAGATGSLVERLLFRLPEQRGDGLRRAWQQLGPTPLSDIEQAQSELLQLARDLGLLPRAGQVALEPSENRRGLASFAAPWQQKAPAAFFMDRSGIGT